MLIHLYIHPSFLHQNVEKKFAYLSEISLFEISLYYSSVQKYNFWSNNDTVFLLYFLTTLHLSRFNQFLNRFFFI